MKFSYPKARAENRRPRSARVCTGRLSTPQPCARPWHPVALLPATSLQALEWQPAPSVPRTSISGTITRAAGFQNLFEWDKGQGRPEESKVTPLRPSWASLHRRSPSHGLPTWQAPVSPHILSPCGLLLSPEATASKCLSGFLSSPSLFLSPWGSRRAPQPRA